MNPPRHHPLLKHGADCRDLCEHAIGTAKEPNGAQQAARVANEVRRGAQAEVEINRLRTERGELRGRLRDAHTELGQLAATCHPGDPRLPDAHDRIREMGRRLTQIEDELIALEQKVVDEAEVTAALADFDALWKCLAPREQSRIIELLVDCVSFDGAAGSVAVTFRPSGIKILAGELAERKEAAA
jgi:site-specific DNA recombinase